MIPRLLDSQPLILLIDDLHFSDEATLLLLRRLLIRQEIPLFICGAAMPIQQAETQRQPVPLESFFAAHHQELNIDRVSLTPLSATDIGLHFQEVFPQLSLPENFEEQLAQLTQGNPLFISEIMRKLILGTKITFTEQGWSLESLEEDYLPRSLEEIVRHKIAILNKESRELLDQASTFGEHVSLSMLAGSTETKEMQVTEFIDQAVAQGLIGSQYQMNDETIRFLSRRILDITYGAIQEKRKEELHERVGKYQETLNSQRLLLSAATLAYHFQLSANREKARFYRDSQQAYDKKIFNGEEAIDYSGERLVDGGPQDVPLNPAALAHVPVVIRGFLTTHRKIRLYPSGSQAIVSATGQLKESIDKVLAHNDRLNITQAKKVLSVNGESLDVTEFKATAEALGAFMTRLSLQGIAFSRGLTGNELRVMLESLDQVDTKMIDRRFWQRFVAKHDLVHIELEQVRYTAKVKPDRRFTVAGTLQEVAPAHSRGGSASLRAAELGLDEQDLTQIPKVVRSLLTTSTNIKLYPPESQVITDSIEELRAVLQTLLEKRPALTLARVQEALLVNGRKVDTKDFEAIADGFLRLLEDIGLRSLSFLKHVSTRELRTFIAALREPPIDGFDDEVWHRLAREQGLTGILFDQRTYGILDRAGGIGTGREEPLEEAITEANGDPEPFPSSATVDPAGQAVVEPETGQLTDAFLQSAETRLRDLFLEGDQEQSGQIIQQMFQEFALQTPTMRTKVIHVCGSLLKDLGLASQPQLVELLVDPLLLALAEEEEPRLLEEMSSLLYRTTTSLIHFAEYRRASRILTHLGKRQRQLQESGEGTPPVFIRELEPETQRILVENLKSQEPTRLQEATQLLGSLGPVATPLLVGVIKEEDNLEARQIASRLLGELGQEPVDLLKRELVLEGFAQQRVRILEVIDTITRDLKKELEYALEDESSKVRRAAVGLVERSNDERLTSLLVDRASHEDPSVATAAIKSLGKIKPTGAVEVLVSLLESAKDEKRVIASCRALGQIADPVSIEPLAQILVPHGFFSFIKKRSSLVRATAAFALAQISHPRVAEVLARHLKDDDSRVRQTARDVVNGLPHS
jgi:HEAT repeat protein